jgi:ribosomal protein S16
MLPPALATTDRSPAQSPLSSEQPAAAPATPPAEDPALLNTIPPPPPQSEFSRIASEARERASANMDRLGDAVENAARNAQTLGEAIYNVYDKGTDLADAVTDTVTGEIVRQKEAYRAVVEHAFDTNLLGEAVTNAIGKFNPMMTEAESAQLQAELDQAVNRFQMGVQDRTERVMPITRVPRATEEFHQAVDELQDKIADVFTPKF